MRRQWIGSASFRQWLVAYSAPSHYLNQCWVIVNRTLRNQLQWNLIEIQNFSFTKMHWKMSSAKWRPFCPGEDELISPGAKPSAAVVYTPGLPYKPCSILLSHWGRDEMADIFQTTFINGFSWMKLYEFWLKFHWSLFLGVQSTIFQHWFR